MLPGGTTAGRETLNRREEMVSNEEIAARMDDTMERVELEGLGKVDRGKVRDSYKLGNRRIIVTTDRVSAFDCIIGTVPLKGQVLNQLAAFWFEETAGIAPNHVIDVPDPNVMVVAECEQLPVEFVVRGYITGVTKTSAWYNYERGVRDFCGNRLPEGMRRDQEFEKPILTPTTKMEKHDRPISREEAVAEGLIDAGTFDRAAEICFKLFDYGTRHALKQGLILVDTKYELGLKNGELTVSDEIHTPDSSRYWMADEYEARFAAGEDQKQIDKEYIRRWLAAQGFRGDGPIPELSDEVRLEAAHRYISAYEMITGRVFEPGSRPVAQRIFASLADYGCSG
jgi:phosphoribosylaminoimidazole-succinocarboxamide synthase